MFYGLMLLPFNGRLLQMVGYLAEDPDKDRAKGLFRWSILYLFGICLLLIISRQPAAALFDLQLRELWLDSGFIGFSGIALDFKFFGFGGMSLIELRPTRKVLRDRLGSSRTQPVCPRRLPVWVARSQRCRARQRQCGSWPLFWLPIRER